MDVEWKNTEMLTMQAGGLLLTRRSQRLRRTELIEQLRLYFIYISTNQ